MLVIVETLKSLKPMDPYITTLALGAAGLGVMALSGMAAGGHGSSAHGHGGGHGAGHVGGHTAGHHGAVTHAHHAHGGHNGHGHTHADGPGAASRALWTIASPRFLFSYLFGFGLAGELLRTQLGGALLLAVALVGGVVFERLLVAPLWNFAMRFASKPAETLDTAVAGEATAVTAFDANGQGIVSVEVDGQVVQILATLQPSDRQLGVRVRAGQRVRIEDVNAAAHQCTVSLL